MAKFAKLFPWLREMFPPSQGVGFQPTEVSEDVSLVQQVLTGTEGLGTALAQTIIGGAGVVSAVTPAVGSGFFWYVLAAGAFHDDPVARDMWISIGGTSVWVLGEGGRAMPTNVPVFAPRAFIVPSHQHVRAEVAAIAGGQKVRLRILYLQIPLGQPAVPSP